MQSILNYIDDLNDEGQKNIKQNAQFMAAFMWEFGIRIAENFFMYNENAQEYAEKILFLQLHHPFNKVLEVIRQDYKKYEIAYDETEMHTILLNSYNKSKEKLNNIEKKCFYI